jgi:hypothetical protein
MQFVGALNFQYDRWFSMSCETINDQFFVFFFRLMQFWMMYLANLNFDRIKTDVKMTFLKSYYCRYFFWIAFTVHSPHRVDTIVEASNNLGVDPSFLSHLARTVWLRRFAKFIMVVNKFLAGWICIKKEDTRIKYADLCVFITKSRGFRTKKEM